MISMDVTTWRVVVTVVSMLAFLGIVYKAYWHDNKDSLQEIAKSILDDESVDPS